MICPSCANEFLQQFVCVTCGAQKLHDHTLEALEKENAELREKFATIRAALAEAIEEADACHDDEHGTPSPNLDAARAVLAKLKQKNGGDFAIDTELKRLGYPL